MRQERREREGRREKGEGRREKGEREERGDSRVDAKEDRDKRCSEYYACYEMVMLGDE